MNNDIDLTIISNCLMADGIGRQGIGLLNTINNDLNNNYYTIGKPNYNDISFNTIQKISKPFNGFGKVSFYTFILGVNEKLIPLHQSIDSKIKICYTMIESSAIPKLWTDIINKYYDVVIVPDEYLVNVYKNCGIKKPIFVLPLGIFIEQFLEQPIKSKRNHIFTFGMSAGFWERKNHIKLIKCFNKLFGNSKDFKLELHGRSGPFQKDIEKYLNALNSNNINLITKAFSQAEYLEFMKNIDCYVFPSKGEGYSITPRESLALGIPTIVTNNTAQKSICNSGYIKSVKADEKANAYYEVFGENIGNFFDCKDKDLETAMLDVYNNYDKYLENSINGREWTKQFLWLNLKDKYLQLFKPTTVEYGNSNIIENNKLITNNKELIKKYENL